MPELEDGEPERRTQSPGGPTGGEVFVTEGGGGERNEDKEDTLEIITPKAGQEDTRSSASAGLFSSGVGYGQEVYPRLSKAPLIGELSSSAVTTPQGGRQPGHFHKPLIEFVGPPGDEREREIGTEGTPNHNPRPNEQPLIQELSSSETESSKPSEQEVAFDHLLSGLGGTVYAPQEHVSTRRPLIVELGSPAAEKQESIAVKVAGTRPLAATLGSPTASYGGEWATPPVRPTPEEDKASVQQKPVEDLLVQDIDSAEEEEEEEGRGAEEEEEEGRGAEEEEEEGRGEGPQHPGAEGEGSHPSDYSHIRLADIPLIKDESEILEVDAVLKRLKTKPPSDWTPEEKVWYLAAKGGSSIESDQLELDSQTKSRVKERLSKAGVLDKVSLSF